MIRMLCILILLLGLQFDLCAQEKFEKEYRIKTDEVPPTALNFVKALNLNTKIRWYFEENLKGNAIEAKFKYRGKEYSVEFDTDGELLDVEVNIDWKRVPSSARLQIDKALADRYKAHKITKIQVQYIGQNKALASIITDQESTINQVVKRYELIVKCTTKKHKRLFEITFDQAGLLETIEEIIPKNTDFIEH